MFHQTWFWIFNLIIAILLSLDLFVFHRKSHVVKVKEALWMTAFWIAIAIAFNVFVYYIRGTEDALNFLTGYLVEKALSVDNLFVFLLIFSYFRVPDHLLHKVLFWGIFGAIVMRAIFILFGIALVQNFHWVIYLFGVFLVITGIKLAMEKDKEIHPESNIIIRLFQRFFPLTPHFFEDKFFIKQNGRYLATPLFLVLIAIETTDVIFAIDSIPAIIGITNDPFIVYTSNILAILGLRSLYFALSHVLKLFHYLHYGLAFILVFIGIKMLISGYITIPVTVSLGTVVSILFFSIVASILNPRKMTPL
jgi:tellurite resistance protein TerC